MTEDLEDLEEDWEDFEEFEDFNTRRIHRVPRQSCCCTELIVALGARVGRTGDHKLIVLPTFGTET